jgi:hypothetical protein
VFIVFSIGVCYCSHSVVFIVFSIGVCYSSHSMVFVVFLLEFAIVPTVWCLLFFYWSLLLCPQLGVCCFSIGVCLNTTLWAQ